MLGSVAWDRLKRRNFLRGLTSIFFGLTVRSGQEPLLCSLSLTRTWTEVAIATMAVCCVMPAGWYCTAIINVPIYCIALAVAVVNVRAVTAS